MNEEIIKYVRYRLSQIPKINKGHKSMTDYLIEYSEIAEFINQHEGSISIVLKKKKGKQQSYTISNTFLNDKLIAATKDIIRNPFTGGDHTHPPRSRGGQPGAIEKGTYTMLARDLYLYYKKHHKTVYGVYKYIAMVFEHAGHKVTPQSAKDYVDTKNWPARHRIISPDFPINRVN